jgi:hypothetical protein
VPKHGGGRVVLVGCPPAAGVWMVLVDQPLAVIVKALVLRVVWSGFTVLQDSAVAAVEPTGVAEVRFPARRRRPRMLRRTRCHPLNCKAVRTHEPRHHRLLVLGRLILRTIASRVFGPTTLHDGGKSAGDGTVPGKRLKLEESSRRATGHRTPCLGNSGCAGLFVLEHRCSKVTVCLGCCRNHERPTRAPRRRRNNSSGSIGCPDGQNARIANTLNVLSYPDRAFCPPWTANRRRRLVRVL